MIYSACRVRFKCALSFIKQPPISERICITWKVELTGLARPEEETFALKSYSALHGEFSQVQLLPSLWWEELCSTGQSSDMGTLLGSRCALEDGQNLVVYYLRIRFKVTRDLISGFAKRNSIHFSKVGNWNTKKFFSNIFQGFCCFMFLRILWETEDLFRGRSCHCLSSMVINAVPGGC